MLLNEEIREQAIELLKSIRKAKWSPIFTEVLTTLLDREKSEQDLQEGIAGLEKLTKDLSSPELIKESAKAFYILGFLHQYGLGVPLDKKLAAQYLELAAKEDIAEAQVKFGVHLLGMYDDNESMKEYIKKDLALGMNYLRAAEKQECSSAKCVLAFCYLAGRGVEKNIKLGIERLKLIADQGDVDAQNILGQLYSETGIEIEGVRVEVEKDLKRSAEYYRLAAEQGDMEAQYSLGQCYKNGAGVEQDFESAIKWFTLAAKQGDVHSQYALGHYYKYEAVEKDLKSAIEWFTLAAKQGHVHAQTALGQCYQYGGEGIEKDLKRAIEWFTLAVEQGDSYARYALGLCYESEKDFKRAVEYLELAVLQGYDIAKCQLGRYYQYGERHFGQTVIREDRKRAAEYYRQAVEGGDHYGKSLLATCYREGYGVPKDTVRADILVEAQGPETGDGPARPALPDYIQHLDEGFAYHQSSLEKEVKTEAERATAYSTIGFCYQLGVQTPKNLAKAAIFYTEAVNRGVPSALWDLFSCYREMLSSDEELGRKKLEQFYKDLEETPYHSDPQMERERLLLLAYLYENGGPHFEQNLFKALKHYQLHSVVAQGIVGVAELSQAKVQAYTPLHVLQQSVQENVVDEVPDLAQFKSILTQYTF